MNRKILSAVVFVVGLTGIAFAAIPFVSSMKPSASAGETLKHINISSLDDGNFLVEDALAKGHFQARYLIVKDYDSKVYVYLVPKRDEKFMLPDHRWWRWGGLCTEFRPETENSKLTPDGSILCHDNEFLEANNPEWRWSYDGRNLGKYTEDMITVPHKIEGPYIIVGKT